MKKNLISFCAILLLFACSPLKKSPSSGAAVATASDYVPVLLNEMTFLLTEVSTDTTYGLSPKNPIEVGGVKESEGPKNEIRFLNALAGPNGEKISFYRAGSCCPIESENDPFGFGSVMLDNYRVSWENSTDTVSIFINMYDSGPMKAPVGFTIKEF